MNMNLTSILQGTTNFSDHDSAAATASESGGNVVVGDLIAANALNPATSIGAATNLSPVAQANVAADTDAIFDPDLYLDLL